MNNLSASTVSALGVFLCFLWSAFLIGWLVQKSHFLADGVQWFRKASLTVRVLAVFSLFGLVALGGGKSEGDRSGGPVRHSQAIRLPQLLEYPNEPSLVPVSIQTNHMLFRPESTNAVDVVSFRQIGGTELGDWIDADTPFFAVGTNPVSRCYVSASGSVSFGAMVRPPIGELLPDETGTPALCPLRAPLGMVPEANQAIAETRSRFWHDTIPDGGKVLTWENILMDRLPGRRVSFQVELQPSGDCVFRYDFQDAFDPPTTNFVMGAQIGTNGVNALSILGTNVLAATVWNVNGAPVINGISLADVLCTNGVLRTPSTFEIHWKNTTGLHPNADTDDDGMTDWEEIFLSGTDPSRADTDGDGITDSVELTTGTDPFNADENGDGIPDGTSEVDWLSNPLWATNTGESAQNITITLNAPIPNGSSASLIVGDLCIPLRTPQSWTLGLIPGELYHYALNGTGDTPINISIGPEIINPLLRSSMDGPFNALWLNGIGGCFDGWSFGGSGNMAVPTLDLAWIPESGSLSHDSDSGICVHDNGDIHFAWTIAPVEVKTAIQHLQLQNLCEDHQFLALSVDAQNRFVEGLAEIPRGCLRFGRVCEIVSAHLCDSSYENHLCSICGIYDYIYSEGHDIEYLTVLPDEDGFVQSEVHFPGEQTRKFNEFSSPVPDMHQPIFYKDVQTVMAEPLIGVEHMIDIHVEAHINPSDEPPENEVCSWRNLVGLSTPFPWFEWENTALFHVPLHGGVFKFQFKCEGFADTDCFLVFPLAGASVDSVIERELLSVDTFVARVKAKYPGWAARNNIGNGLKWFVNNGAGDFLGRPDNRTAPTVWFYNQVDDSNNFGAVATWGGKCVRLAKMSNFIDAYACQKIGVSPLSQAVAQLIGTRNSISGTTSWQCGVELANGTMTLSECAEAIASSCWDEGDEKVKRLWPNSAPADNFVEPDFFTDPNTQFTIPGFLRMINP